MCIRREFSAAELLKAFFSTEDLKLSRAFSILNDKNSILLKVFICVHLWSEGKREKEIYCGNSSVMIKF